MVFANDLQRKAVMASLAQGQPMSPGPVRKTGLSEDVSHLRRNERLLAAELKTAEMHIADILKDSGHTVRLIGLDIVHLRKDGEVAVVAYVKEGKHTVEHLMGTVSLAEKMVAADLKDIIADVKARFRKTVGIWNKPIDTPKVLAETDGNPFAGYRSFSGCVKANPDKRDPAAYCAVIKRRVEGK